MSTITRARTIVIVGAHPRTTAADLLDDAARGDKVHLLLLGLVPTPPQLAISESAIDLAFEREIELVAEVVPTASRLRQCLRDGDDVRVIAGRREQRRWRLAAPSPRAVR